MASNLPVNINLANIKELKTLHGISNGQARAIISTHKHLGGSMTVDDFKSITKIGYNVWQLLLEKDAITFGPAGPSGPGNAARANHQASSTLESSPVPLNQDASSPEHSISPPAQSTPVQMAPAHLQFPPQSAITLTLILEHVPLTPGIHPGLGGPDLTTVPQWIPVPPAHPNVESGLPVVANPDMVSHAVQFAEGVSEPHIGMDEELALMREALQATEEALAAECDQFQAAAEALAIKCHHFQHTKQAYEEELQVAQAALVEEQKQLNSVKQAFQGELETAQEQLHSSNHSYQDKLAGLGQSCARNEQNAQVMQ